MSIWKKYSDVSKAAWLEKISTDLKGKEAADFHKKQADGTLIKPWYHREDTGHEVSIPGRSYDKIHLGCMIDAGDPTMDHDYLMDNLTGGCSFIHIDAKKDDSLTELLEGVHFEMITSIIHMTDGADQNSFLSGLKERKDVDIQIIDGSSGTSILDLRVANEKLLSAFMTFAEEMSQSNETDAVHVLLDFDHDYISSITKVMALRLLWANVCEAYSRNHRDHRLIISGYVSDAIRTTEIHQDLIAITQVMTAMFSADVDVIFPFSSTDTAEDRRLIRQAYHVLTLEGHLGKVRAPYSGSYALEKIASEKAKAAWKDFIKTI